MQSPGRLTSRGRRAIVLISILFVSVLLVMFIVAAISLAPSGLIRGRSETLSAAADQAAQSGIDWARSRLSMNPSWNAAAAQTFTGSGLRVREGAGQVEGWIQGPDGWSRFRLRFNYQDGPASSAPNSDGLNDPATPWSEPTLVSCNNLLGNGSRVAPVASAAGVVSAASPWPATQLTVPPATLLLSVQGAAGPTVVTAGVPTFAGKATTRTVQAMLKFGLNQPISESALMGNGGVSVTSYNSATQLQAVGAQTARVRSKGNLAMSGGVTSADGDLRYGSGAPSVVTTGRITMGLDGSDPLYQIPASLVRTPSTSITLPAGVYVVTGTGALHYVNMKYSDWAGTFPHPVGTPTSLPSGLSISGPHPSGPKYIVTATTDIRISSSGAITDFALVPDGGAPQSEDYGGVVAGVPTATGTASSSGTPALPYTTTQIYDFIMSTYGPDPAIALPIWRDFCTRVYGPGTPSGNWRTWNVGGGKYIQVRNYATSGAGVIVGPGFSSCVAALANSMVNHPDIVADLVAAYWGAGAASYSPTPAPTATASSAPGLSTADVQLSLQGGASGSLVLANEGGSIVIGSQIVGNGAAIVSAGNIALIGTSTQLSSTPGADLGLNLYARGTVTIDSFGVDGSSSAFHDVEFQGVVYAWQGVNCFLGSTLTSANFKLTGAMVAYGGDPAGSATPGSGAVDITAGNVKLVYDPTYVANLLNSGPFVLKVVAWHAQ